MKTVLVNRQNHPATFKSCKKLGELISWVEMEGEKEKLFITQMYLNNKVLDNEEENLLDSLSINEVEELKVEMETIQEILGKTMSHLIAKIQDIQIKVAQFCRDFRDNEKIDDEKVKYILIQCRSVIDSLEEIFKAHVSKKMILKHHSLWIEAEKELTNILQCILQSRGLSDVNFITELLDYDLIQALSSWDEVLEKEMFDNSQISSIFSLKNTPSAGDNGVNV